MAGKGGLMAGRDRNQTVGKGGLMARRDRREGGVLRGRWMLLIGSVSSLFRLSLADLESCFVRLRFLSCGGCGELVDFHLAFAGYFQR